MTFVYLLLGLLLAYFLYDRFLKSPNSYRDHYNQNNQGFITYPGMQDGGNHEYFDKAFGRAVEVEKDELEDAFCQTRQNLVPKDPCKLGKPNGLNILTYLGLGPADQDQLNIINHKDHNNLAWILRRPLKPPRKLINNLQESNTGPATGPYSAADMGKIFFKTWNPCKCDVGIVNLDRPPTELEGVTDAVAERLVDGETHNILYNLSPDFMRTDLKQYYGGLYYNDVRYPERPLSTEFATDPAGYCMRHPQEYPCPLIASRKDIR